MITQAMDRTRFLSRHSRRGVLAIGLGFGMGLALGLVPGPEAQAAKLSASAATNAPLKYPTYLDGEGQILSDSAATHALAAKDKSRAAYVAYKLQDGAKVSKAIPLMKSDAPLPTAARQAMTTVTSGIGKMAVKTQSGLYLLNSYQKAQRHAAQHVSTSHVAVRAQHIVPHNATGSGTPTTPTSNPTTGAQGSSAPLIPPSGLLALDPPKATASETQTTSTPTTAPSGLVLVPAGNVLEAPVPEPGTFAFAGLAIVGIAVRHGLKRRKAALA